MLSVGIRRASAGNARGGGLRQFAVGGVLHKPCLRGPEGLGAVGGARAAPAIEEGTQACVPSEDVTIGACSYRINRVIDRYRY